MRYNTIRFCAIIFFFASALPCFGQLTTSNDLGIVREIPIKSFIGKRFKAGVDIKNIPSDSIGLAGFFFLQVGKGDYDFVPGTRQSKPATNKDSAWHHYEIAGTVASSAQKVWLYVNTRGNGDFYYDNFSFEVETAAGSWKKVAIPNADFEESPLPLKGFRGTETLKEKQGVKIELALDSDQNILHHLHIHSRNAKIIYPYGRDKLKGKHIDVAGSKIYYETYGSGEPLLLLHGNGGSISDFKSQIGEFAKHFQVIAVDTRAQGKSSGNKSESLSYDLFAEDMETLLDSLHLKNVNILGCSDGGNTGLTLAIKNPDYVKRLVVMGANLNPEESSVSPKILKQTKSDLNKLKAKNNPDDKNTMLLLEMLLKEPQIDQKSLKNITAKTLVLAGEKDIILEAHTRSIAEVIPGAELQLLQGATHFAPKENPSAFNKIVLDFLMRK